MSNYQAIATVTAALRQRLLETVPHDVPGATVTALRPAEPSQNGIPSVGVNIFLFAIHIDPAQRFRFILRRTSADHLLLALSTRVHDPRRRIPCSAPSHFVAWRHHA